MNTKQIKVWDSAVRLFHWSLVIAFTIAYLTGEDESDLHIYSGYIVLGLIVFRIIWGFIGSQHARFTDFVFSPSKVIAYAKSMKEGKPKHYLGHNPLGGAMIIALLLTLLATTVTGLKVYGAEGHGPLANSETSYFISTANASVSIKQDRKSEDNEEEEFWEEIHEFFANLMIVLIVLHIAGVVVSGRLDDENLVKAMITGNKTVK